MKRMLLLVLIIVLSFSSLAACSNSASETSAKKESTNAASPETSTKKPVEIQFLHIHGGSQGEAVKRLVEEFNKKQDAVHVTPVYVEGSYEGILEKLQALAATKQLPEVTQAGFSYTNYMVANMPLVPVQKFIDEEKMDLSDFFPKMLELGKGMDGKIYGLPYAVSTPVVYYNKQMFKEAGLDPENPPKTFDELREAAKKLTKGDRMGVYFNYGITGNWMFQAMTETLGGHMVANDQKSVAFDQEPGIKALQYWVDLVNTDKTMPLIDDKQATQSFTSGKLGIYVNTTASLRGLQKDSKFDIGTAAFPVDGVHPRMVPAGGNNVFVIKSTPEKEKAAWEFIKFATSPEGTAITAEGMGYMASRKSAVERDDLLGKYLKQENPAAYTTYRQVDDMVQWNNFPGKGGTRIFKIVQDNIQAALTKQKTAEQAVKDAAAEANQLIK
ncbi:ABC transporter substrate-binding protein [Ferviditalea candida]|uniref:ABC transporter substrate-binding protein n=1 Tax=Ferviditalea candida TaxID=3108399 RepID=A0ABU5ZMG9_9BACL|nr:ABC transporter substrate-binding protein [Paenibacillaceae bacterium T2]